MPDIPYVTEKKNLSSEPASNWKSVEYFKPTRAADLGDDSQRQSSNNIRRSFLASSIRASVTRAGTEELFSLVRHTERPSEFHSIHDLEINEVCTRVKNRSILPYPHDFPPSHVCFFDRSPLVPISS
jgi:hypothetical protein